MSQLAFPLHLNTYVKVLRHYTYLTLSVRGSTLYVRLTSKVGSRTETVNLNCKLSRQSLTSVNNVFQTCGVHRMPVQCWASGVEGGPIVIQDLVNLCFFLGRELLIILSKALLTIFI